MDSSFLLLDGLPLPAKESRIKFRREQRVLESFHHPVDDRHDHLNVHVVAQFVALQPEADESHRAIGIFADEETINLAPQYEIGPVVPEKRDAVRNPIVVQQMFGANQPVAQNVEKSCLS